MSGECDKCDEHCLDCRCNNMEKYDNEWNVEEVPSDGKEFVSKVTINGEAYYMPEHYAGIAHALLLIVDAINDK